MPETEPVVNLDEIKEIMDNDMELIGECFDDFVQEWPVLYVQIKTAVLEKNGPNLDASAHKLKGTLRYLAAEPAALAAYALEEAGKAGNMDGLDEHLETLRKECQKVIDYIKNFSG